MASALRTITVAESSMVTDVALLPHLVPCPLLNTLDVQEILVPMLIIRGGQTMSIKFNGESFLRKSTTNRT